MKTVTVREFYHNAGLVDGLAEGKQLVVTANGKPKFVVSKSTRPKMSRELAEKRAVGGRNAPSFNGTAFLASLKK
jgi:antitoxin (DNA-binding transcriptional repressor) of toxin-antitoxin stability system